VNYLEFSIRKRPKDEMKRNEVLQRLQTIANRGLHVLCLLEGEPRAATSEVEIRRLTAELRSELETEYTRTLRTRAQKAMSIFELSVYSPAIEEMWMDTGIRRLKTEGAITGTWNEVVEAVVYKTSKYLAQ
jgi:hypothetical protein